jgi:hypothetical protein
MPDEPLALSTASSPPTAAEDYDAIHAAVAASARGRWFLDEYARRNRSADTRLVLAAIERMERALSAERGHESYRRFRAELLEMANAIADTRAAVDGGGPDAGTPEPAATPPAPAPPGVIASAERIQEVVWTMRERGIDPATCDQIAALAAAILSASALRDPHDRRAHALGEVLAHLERRIEAMLAACPPPEAAAALPTPANENQVLPAQPLTEPALPAVAPVASAVAVTAEAPGQPPSLAAAAAIEPPLAEAGKADSAVARLPQPPEAAAAAPAAIIPPAAPKPPRPPPRPISGDPLAALKALTDEERIALFS